MVSVLSSSKELSRKGWLKNTHFTDGKTEAQKKKKIAEQVAVKLMQAFNLRIGFQI